MGRGMVLGKVACQGLGTRAPVNQEVTLVDAVTDPMETHVYSLGATLANGGVDDSSGGWVIGLERGRRLRVAELDEGSAEDGTILRIDE
jgi:hypothetical protein